MDSLYKVVITGKLRTDVDSDQAKTQLSALFKKDRDHIERIFSGKPLVVKKNVSAAAAEKLRQALHAAGAECRTLKENTPPKAPPVQSQQPAAQGPLPPEILAGLFKGELRPLRPTLGYRLGLLAVAALMLALPSFYILLTGLTGFGTLWYAVNAFDFITTGSIYFRIILYAVPILAGLAVFAFMLKPLFAKTVPRSPSLEIQPQQEPTLFALAHQIADFVGAPRPKSIEVDCQVNASASFHGGLNGLRKQEMTLTIGVPLIAGMDTRQLAGILAHEFGHFAQGAGMSTTFLIRWMTYWLYRSAHERDKWDEKLDELVETKDTGIVNVFAMIKFAVAGIRALLAGLHWIAVTVSHYLLRQMEFDADRYEAQVAGSDHFKETSYRLWLLMYAFDDVQLELNTSWSDRKLANDLPSRIARRADEIEPTVREHIEYQMHQQQTSIFDTHPGDLMRIDHAEKLEAKGIFHLAVPAKRLVRDYSRLARLTTERYYRDELGLDFSSEQLVSDEHMDASVKAAQEGQSAIQEYFRDLFLRYRFLSPIPLKQTDTPQPEQKKLRLNALVSEIRQAMPEIRNLSGEYASTGDQLTDAYVVHSFNEERLPSHILRRPEGSHETLKEKFGKLETALSRHDRRFIERMSLALSSLPNRHEEIKPLLTAQHALHGLQSACDGMHMEATVLYRMARLQEEAAQQSEPRELVTSKQIEARLRYIDQHKNRIESTLSEIPYPFDRAGQKVSIRYHLNEELPGESGHRIDDTLAYVQALLNGVYRFHERLMGHLAMIANQHERELGVEPIRLVRQPEKIAS